MDLEKLEDLKKFIENERGKQSFLLNENTELYKDLNIYGDDANEFFIAFSKKFNVDVSNFMASEYFNDEGIDIIAMVIKIITGKRPQYDKGKKPLTLANLVKAISAGKLDEEIING
jgi:acyl carrier protein